MAARQPQDKADDVGTLYGGPTKRFFVSMLTRDIELDDAILDLLDNSVDGALRLVSGKILSSTPYKGYWANLTIGKGVFQLIDNCGGIPDNRLDAAFRLGRPQTDLDKDIPTIGMFGIGMKRAIFKMGREASVKSSSPDGIRRVRYTKAWLDDDTDGKDEDQKWELAIERWPPKKEKGVTVDIGELRPETSKTFSDKHFVEDLKRKVAVHFGYLILRGFIIEINGDVIRPDTLKVYTTAGKGSSINPYDYVGFISGVRVRVTVGFNRPLPRLEEIDEETEAPRTRERAGISVICNDRVILSNDTTFRTGWGTRTVPKFHNQFMAVGGFISFHSNDASALPVSTTKTGVEMDSEVYDHALTICAAALKIFTGFTNSWKGRLSETQKFFDAADPKDAYLNAELSRASKVSSDGSHTYKPSLPKPPADDRNRRISFVRPKPDVDLLSMYLFNEIVEPSVVGARCFDQLRAKASESTI
jgi:hypothetical protein